MIWQNNDISKFVADNAQYSPVPDELFNKIFSIWDIDFSKLEGQKNIDWERFIVGQKTMHTTYLDSFHGAVIGGSLEYGNSTSSFESMFKENDSISLLLKYDVYSSIQTSGDIQYKLVTLGNDTENWYVAKLFNVKFDLDGEFYQGRLELVSLKYVLEQFNDDEVGYIQNIKIGNFGETVKVPDITYDSINNTEVIGTKDYTRITPSKMEVFIPTATGMIGLDLLNKDGTRIKDSTFSTDTTIFPSHKDEYSILPTQFKIFSVDNYGMTHQSDMTNAIRSIMFTDALSTQTTTSTSSEGGLTGAGATALNAVMKLAPGANSLYQQGTSMGKKIFGDKSEAATQPALGTKNLSDDSSLLKVFIESDMIDTTRMENINGKQYLDISKQDVFEINGRKGTAATFNSDLLPDGVTGVAAIGKLLQAGEYAVNGIESTLKSIINGLGQPGKNNVIIPLKNDSSKSILNENGSLTTSTKYNILGVSSLNQNIIPSKYKQIKAKVLPWLRLPYAKNNGIKTDQNEIDYFINFGCPRRTVSSTKLSNPYSMENWETYIRSNHFRPDAYSWWNWPIMYPSSVVNIWTETNDSNFINYDRVGVGNAERENNHWSRGFTAGQFTNNDFQDVENTFFSFSADNLSNDFSKIESMLITAGQAIVKVLDDNGNEEEFKFNSTGSIYGTSAKVNNIWTF